ncbi:MAG: hypothetical protein JWQ57_3652 [Mucilaginibacter sp.]|nr:hypothetical protein [Mucilaginibacter sp.]
MLPNAFRAQFCAVDSVGITCDFCTSTSHPRSWLSLKTCAIRIFFTYIPIFAHTQNMALRQTISFFDKLSKQVISIQVAESAQLPQSAGYWNTDTNQILLGMERFSEWETLTGHLEKQIEFIFSLQKVTRPLMD